MPSLSNGSVKNIQLRPKTARSRHVVIEKLNTELAADRILGSYRCSPMPTAVFSPSNVIPKSTQGKFRLNYGPNLVRVWVIRPSSSNQNKLI